MAKSDVTTVDRSFFFRLRELVTCACARQPADRFSYDDTDVAADFPANFTYSASTEDNFSVPHFVGKYRHLRPLVDYSYHGLYRASRCKVQDAIIDHFLGQPTCNTIMPWVVFTAGAMGAGKGYTMRWMSQQGYVPLDEFVCVDPDAIRQALPEWHEYVRRDAGTAGCLTQKEAGMIAELLGLAALRSRCNVIFDGSLRDTEWYKTYFAKLRVQFPGVRIAIFHIVADRQETLNRARKRGEQTGRYVPIDVLENSMKDVPQSVSVLAGYADFVCRIANHFGKLPQIQREPGAPNPVAGIPMNWCLLKSLWRPLDTDGDGNVSEQEIKAALDQGRLTLTALRTIDADGDGQVSSDEIDSARIIAQFNATKTWR